MEKVVQANLFHHFREKNFLRNSWKKWKKLSWPTFFHVSSRLEAQIVEKVGFDIFPLFPRISEEVFGIIITVEKVVQANLFHHFREKKLPQKFVEKVEKVVKTNFFPRLKPFWRPKSWKKLVLTTFSTIFMIPKTSPKIRGKSCQVVKTNFFYDSSRFGGPNRGKCWFYQ